MICRRTHHYKVMISDQGAEEPVRYAEALDALVDRVNSTDDEDELMRILVETVSEFCSPVLTAVWSFDEATAGLSPHEYVSADGIEDPEEVLSGTEEIAWEAYSDGSAYRRSDELLPDSVPDSVSTCVSVSVGGEGVLTAFIPSENEPTEVERTLTRSVAALVSLRIEASESKEVAKRTEEKLDEYVERADELEEMIETIRRTSQKLLSATTRTEIVQAVCRQLVASPFVEFAWIGEYVESGDEMVSEYSTDNEYLKSLEASGGTEMAKETARRREPSFVSDLRGKPPLEPWREQALRYGFRSVMRVPVLHKSSMYGVLTVYSAEIVEEDDHLWSAVRDIGNIVGHAINTYETKTALVSDRVTEIRFSVGDPTFPAVRFASAVEGSVSFENATTEEEGPHRVYVSIESEADDRREKIEEVAEETPLVESYSHITTRDDAEVYSLVGDISFFQQILDRSGTLLKMNATADEAEMLVELPRYASMKSFLSMVEGEYDDVEVLSTRTKEKEFKTESGFRGELKEELTERQLETLQTAYYSGYFESPRESTGRDIAEQLGVTQPTVTENIKAGQSKLLQLLFDG